MIALFPELSFGDNLRPSQVTPELRQELADGERRRRNLLLFVPSFLMLTGGMAGFAGVSYEIRPFTAWPTMLGSLIGVWATYLLIIWSIYYRRIRFLRDAKVTTAAVMDKETTSLWAVGGSLRGSWSTRLPRNIQESLNMEDDGTEENVPHIAKLRLRFIPGAPGEHLDWPALRDEVPHCEVTRRLPGGGWGRFIGDLRQGSLVSVLYSPENPKRCRIVQRFKSHEQLKGM